jgi:predicted SnoaL-like aldol condensation-catalyzing enzyme
MTTTKQLVVEATSRVFGGRNVAAVDIYFSPTYIQHSGLAAPGIEGLRSLVSNLPEGFRYEPARVLADGGLVVLHGVYHGFGPDPLVAFDIFRVEHGKIVEHWDALTPVVANTVSGRSQTDGPNEPTDTDKADANRALVREFVEKVLVGSDYSALTDYISTDTYDQHNPEAADGLEGFGAAAAKWAQQGKNLVYKKVHQVVADGESSCSSALRASSASPSPITTCGGSTMASSLSTGTSSRPSRLRCHTTTESKERRKSAGIPGDCNNGGSSDE